MVARPAAGDKAGAESQIAESRERRAEGQTAKCPSVWLSALSPQLPCHLITLSCILTRDVKLAPK